MDLDRPKWTNMDQNGPRWTKIDKMDQNGLKWTKLYNMDKIMVLIIAALISSPPSRKRKNDFRGLTYKPIIFEINVGHLF